MEDNTIHIEKVSCTNPQQIGQSGCLECVIFVRMITHPIFAMGRHFFMAAAKGVLVLMPAVLQGCGVLFGGTHFNGEVVVRNNPSVNIRVEDRFVGRGTALGRFSRGRPLKVQLQQEGCEPQQVVFPNRVRTANFLLSFLTWSVLGAVVDVVSGASYKPDHKNNPNVTRENYKTFVFVVDYTGCRNTALER